VSKLGGETPSRIKAWSLIRNEKPIVLFERHCHAACMCKELPVILVNKVVDPKRIIRKMLKRCWHQKRISWVRTPIECEAAEFFLPTYIASLWFIFFAIVGVIIT
jgi:hypothetical protein